MSAAAPTPNSRIEQCAPYRFLTRGTARLAFDHHAIVESAQFALMAVVHTTILEQLLQMHTNARETEKRERSGTLHTGKSLSSILTPVFGRAAEVAEEEAEAADEEEEEEEEGADVADLSSVSIAAVAADSVLTVEEGAEALEAEEAEAEAEAEEAAEEVEAAAAAGCALVSFPNTIRPRSSSAKSSISFSCSIRLRSLRLASAARSAAA